MTDPLPPLYAELRRLAAAKMANESPGHTLNATALVHEAWMRLGGDGGFDSKAAFVRAAAEVMRRILVDHARTRNAAKRGGAWNQVPLTDLAAPADEDDLEALNEALTQLEQHDATAAELVKLRYFCGYSHTESAELLRISRRKADGLWTLARTWLYQRLHAHASSSRPI